MAAMLARSSAPDKIHTSVIFTVLILTKVSSETADSGTTDPAQLPYSLLLRIEDFAKQNLDKALPAFLND